MKQGLERYRDEYLAVHGFIDSMDSKCLTIKAWSVTVSMFGIGTAYIADQNIILLLSSFSAAVFWRLEYLWKRYQNGYLKRSEEIEKMARRDESSQLPELQIATVWNRTYDEAGIRERLMWGFGYESVWQPHLLIVLTGIGLFVADLLDLVSV